MQKYCIWPLSTRKWITLKKQPRYPANIPPSRSMETCCREVVIPKKSPLKLPVGLFGLFFLSFSNSSCWCLALKRHNALRAAGCITILRTLCLQQILFPVSTCVSCWVVKCGFKPPCHSWLGRHFTGDTRCILLERWRPLSRLEWEHVDLGDFSFPLCLTTKYAVALITHSFCL